MKVTKKKKRTIIVVCAVIVLVLASPWILLYGIAGVLMLEEMKVPDNSQDPLIPTGYVETDGEQSVGGGDWVEYNEYVYEAVPQFNGKYNVVSSSDDEKLSNLLNHFCEAETTGDGELYSKISNNDLYYIDRINGDPNDEWGALIYFFDKETKTLYRIDYRW